MNKLQMKEGCGQEYLTGGTRDVNPQIWRAQMEVDENLTQNKFPTGTMILPGNEGAYVMEALRVIWEFEGTIDIQAAEVQHGFEASLATEQPIGGTGTWGSNSFLFSKMSYSVYNASGTGEAVAAFVPNIFEYDLTDGAGHGVLLASNEIWMSTDFADILTPINVSAAILFRWKKISMADFVGLWNNWNR